MALLSCVAVVVAVLAIRGRGQTRADSVGPGDSRHSGAALPTGRGTGEAAALTFDLSGDRSLAAVGWPEAEAGEQYWMPEGLRSVNVLLPGGRRERYLIDKAMLRREGNHVVAVGLDLLSESTDDVYRHAVALAKAWSLRDPERLDKWHARRLKDGGFTPDDRFVFLVNFDTVPAVRLDILADYRVGSPPWRIDLTFGFANAAAKTVRAPTTAPAPGGPRTE